MRQMSAQMSSPTNLAVETTVQPLAAPVRLTSDLRLEFRRAVLESLEAVTAAGEAVVVVDLSRTVEIDASGLGVLVLLQKRARERGIRTSLRDTPRAVVDMLTMTRLATLFDLTHA